MADERVQRRLAAILVADVVGYSRLIEADEEGTRARLKSLLSELIDPKIAADGGRIVKTTGDGADRVFQRGRCGFAWHTIDPDRRPDLQAARQRFTHLSCTVTSLRYSAALC